MRNSMEYLQHPEPTPSLPNKHREPIDWDENYGQSFKAVKTPIDNGQIEDKTMIVTPNNIEQWNNWEEITEKNLYRLKKNWNIIQRNLSEYKYKEIFSFCNHLKKS
jgi:hypothetical protein